MKKTPLLLIPLILIFTGCELLDKEETTASVNVNKVVEESNQNLNQSSEQNNNDTEIIEEDINIEAEIIEGNNFVEEDGWLTYKDDEYGFVLQYPDYWTINSQNDNNLKISINNINEFSENEPMAPVAQASPFTRSENIEEKNNLEKGLNSTNDGKLFQNLNNVNFYKYVNYVENGTIIVEYVTFKGDNKISISYLEGDNSEYVKELEKYSRSELLEQYKNDNILNQKLSEKYEEFQNIIQTFKYN